MNDDRRVHARHPEGEEVVRYDRRGHWQIELVEPSQHAPMSKRVTLKEAVERAVELSEWNGEVFLDLPGGGRFDALYRRSIRSVS